MNILITGASRGIGYELVKWFTKEPSHKLVLLSRDIKKLDQLAEECKNSQPYSQIICWGIDLTKPSNLIGLNKKLELEMDHLDIVINNAGFLINKPFEKITSDEIDSIFKVNIMGPMEIIKACLPLLKNSKMAHVLNISSMGGFQGSVKFPGLASYASSKAAIACLTECLAEEFKELPIKFNCLALGAVATEMLAEAFPGYNALTSAAEMAEFIGKFALEGHYMFNGKILPVSISTP